MNDIYGKQIDATTPVSNTQLDQLLPKFGLPTCMKRALEEEEHFRPILIFPHELGE